MTKVPRKTQKALSAAIALAEAQEGSSGMGDDTGSAVNQILNHCAKPLALHSAFGRCLSQADSILPDKTQSVVGKGFFFDFPFMHLAANVSEDRLCGLCHGAAHGG